MKGTERRGKRWNEGRELNTPQPKGLPAGRSSSSPLPLLFLISKGCMDCGAVASTTTHLPLPSFHESPAGLVVISSSDRDCLPPSSTRTAAMGEEKDDPPHTASSTASTPTTTVPSTPDPLLIPSLSTHRSLVILYGSQSGSALELSHRLSLDAYQRGFHPITHLPLDAFPLSLLATTSLLFIITSTQGNADPPDNARTFYRSLLRRHPPIPPLSHLHFSVFGLGDSGYPIYNAIARRIYQRLLDLGAVSIFKRGLGDDQHPYGYEGGWEEWRAELWPTMRRRLAWLAEGREEDVDTTRIPPPPFSLTFEEEEENLILPASPWCRVLSPLPLPSPSSLPILLPPFALPPWGVGASLYHPYPALLTHNCRLTPLSHFQDVRHLRFSLTPSHPPFHPGDVVDVFPRNDPTLVSAFLSSLSLNPSTIITLTPTPSPGGLDGAPRLPPRCTLQELCEVHLDIAGTPKRSFFAFLASYAVDPIQREKLLELCTKEGQQDLWRYCQKEKRTYGEVLEDFHSARPPLVELIAHIPRLAPRSFSISSASALHPGHVDVTAALVQFTTPWKRKRVGVCSAFFGLLPQSKGDEEVEPVVYVSVCVKRGAFALPKEVGWGGPPVLMIGPGTGVAPFRAMCQWKEAMLTSSPTPTATFSPFLLIFGNRNRHSDFLYEEEWGHFHEVGVLTRPVVTAFSRDQDEKVYVQDRMMEEGVRGEVFDLLYKRRGIVIVAGSSGAMPREVRRALVRVIQVEGGMEETEAQAYLRTLEKERRYIQETW